MNDKPYDGLDEVTDTFDDVEHRPRHAATQAEAAQSGHSGSTATERASDTSAANPGPAPLSEGGEESSDEVDRGAILGSDGRWLAGWALRFVILVIAATLLWFGLAKIWVGLLPILLAILLCTVLWPPVRWLRSKKVPAGLSALLVILGFFAIFGGVIAAIAPSITSQSQVLWKEARRGADQLVDWVQGPPLNLRLEQFNGLMDQVASRLQQQSSQITSGVFSGLSAASSIAVTFVVMLVLTFFFLKDGTGFLPFVRRYAGHNAGWHLSEVLTRTWNTLAGFIRAQAIVSLVDAVLIGAGLLILQVPLALALATITFFAGFIPIVGAISAGTIAVLIALVSNGVGTAIAVLALILIVQQLEGNVLSPILQSKAMNLHPVIVLLSVTVGSTLFGIIGAFLAVPVAATLAVWLRYHSDLVALRAGEITADDIEIATAKGDQSSEGLQSFETIRQKMLALGTRKESSLQSTKEAKKSQDDED
ncbi:AI-2E family transporter [Corynebacterium sp. TAE3-ERU2]|uniref:AI-2E family transporter n=1 Tax=Corynebacterium sp. TAE3-ERU2 TaxID=2849497 RepID=UPI001C48C30F|nr:AI-2E family transporter [Corynebacterium sp. TAE3-ERU2]MBV7302155.1 AI-2E family transporter [Corynebacterium sp. TAE3-ERU2]